VKFFLDHDVNDAVADALRRHAARTECTNVLRLIERAGESGLAQNINFA
jgi:hypothetical protein